ncbi:peroxiredoxin [Halarchaeum rubridurum]|uniref:Peroxiredoxin n=1 Tax=Halarchaeum rubridurum TaxID=489911 RepID=A0A830G1D5_9EURY|nr:redoxin domain-containing protein [Halarchaeum rubridurum]MBP1954883.1 peroxiredoxin [Halarchaeum rubridurum]GGM70669.1 peroxiredoxin [Halarchaeum rubridurum]
MVDFDVSELPEANHPEVGETAPDFTRPLVNAEFWEDAALSDLTGEGPVLLVFHPMDGAFPTTYMWQEFVERDFADVQVVGVSISTPYEHATTIEERGLDEAGYRLFSDPGNEVAEAYGISHDLDGMTGVSEPRPSVFLVEEDRTVAYAWTAREWPDFPEYDAVEAAVADL